MIKLKRVQAPKQISNINITPFTDVVLVLLIIFMVTVPAIVKEELTVTGYRIQLPREEASSVLPATPLMLRLEYDNTCYFNDVPVELRELEGVIKAELSKSTPDMIAHTLLVVHADERLPYGMVARIMAIAGRAGITETVLAFSKPVNEASRLR